MPFRSAALALLMIPAAFGCGSGGSPTPEKTSSPAKTAEKKGTIGVSVLTLTNPFFKVIADTITEEAAQARATT